MAIVIILMRRLKYFTMKYQVYTAVYNIYSYTTDILKYFMIFSLISHIIVLQYICHKIHTLFSIHFSPRKITICLLVALRTLSEWKKQMNEKTFIYCKISQFNCKENRLIVISEWC